MKKKMRKPLKSLMLTAMALLTATATAVNASSYSIIIEHIWDDNNNAYGTRPDEIKTEIDQITGDGAKTETDLDFTEDGKISDDGSEQGKTEGGMAAEKGDDVLKQEAVEKGKEDGAQAGADAKDRLEDVKEDQELTDPGELPDPEKGELVSPDAPELQPDHVLKDFEKDGQKYTFSAEEKQKYEESLKAYKEAYDTYMAAEDKTGSYANYKEAYEKMQEALKAVSKAETTSEPGGSDAGFKDGFSEGLKDGGSELTADELNKIYQDAYDSAFDDAYKGNVSVEAPEETKKDLEKEIENELGKYDADSETANTIVNKVNDLVENMVSDAMGGNLWKTETELGVGDVRDENGNPLNYRPGEDPKADVSEKGKNYLEETLGISEDELKQLGYTTTQLRIEITIVEDKDEDGNATGEQRIYVSVDGGTHFEGVNEAAKKQAYVPAEDIVEVTKLTFLHTLEVKYTPPELDVPVAPDYDEPTPEPKREDPENPKDHDPEDPKDPKDPENPIFDEEVPLTGIEEDPEEEIPEEDVPLTEIPKTGDSSLIWMCAAMFSGTALLALLKKEKETQEA